MRLIMDTVAAMEDVVATIDGLDEERLFRCNFNSLALKIRLTEIRGTFDLSGS